MQLKLQKSKVQKSKFGFPTQNTPTKNEFSFEINKMKQEIKEEKMPQYMPKNYSEDTKNYQGQKNKRMKADIHPAI